MASEGTEGHEVLQHAVYQSSGNIAPVSGDKEADVSIDCRCNMMEELCQLWPVCEDVGLDVLKWDWGARSCHFNVVWIGIEWFGFWYRWWVGWLVLGMPWVCVG